MTLESKRRAGARQCSKIKNVPSSLSWAVFGGYESAEGPRTVRRFAPRFVYAEVKATEQVRKAEVQLTISQTIETMTRSF